jgi:hypothetical protein
MKLTYESAISRRLVLLSHFFVAFKYIAMRDPDVASSI